MILRNPRPFTGAVLRAPDSSSSRRGSNSDARSRTRTRTLGAACVAVWLASASSLHANEPGAGSATGVSEGTENRALTARLTAGPDASGSFLASFRAAAAIGASPSTPAAPAQPTPAGPMRPILRETKESWKLDDILNVPDWLSLKGHQRTRYESFDEHFRAGRSGSGQGFFTRTALQATAHLDGIDASIELLDSRQFDIPNDLPLNSGIVNSLDVLQAYVATSLEDAWQSGARLDLKLGRHTMNVGSRRFVARNRFRNTINAFTGLNSTWTSAKGDTIQAFYVIPVVRLPRDRTSLGRNEQDFDEERSQVRFAGIHAKKKNLSGSIDGEAYLFALDEDDAKRLRTRNRELITVGFRLLKKPKAGELDFDVEAVYQTGDSRASTASADRTDLDHQAEFVHLSTGYQFEGETEPRAEFLFDYASGDDTPTDGDRNRFDTLFGARRFEYGPTGIFGAFARSNIMTPGLRFWMKPTKSTQLMVTTRFHYLASDKDAWTTSGLVDPTGGSGDYIGNLTEFRLRWDPRPNLRVELGMAHLFAGSFIDDAPNATTQGDSTYAYVGTTLTF